MKTRKGNTYLDIFEIHLGDQLTCTCTIIVLFFFFSDFFCFNRTIINLSADFIAQLLAHRTNKTSRINTLRHRVDYVGYHLCRVIIPLPCPFDYVQLKAIGLPTACFPSDHSRRAKLVVPDG